MTTPPLVSVVIPSYQHAPFVGRAVESVLAQTVTDIEVIVVDDGSTDGTPDIVAAISDPRLKLVRCTVNRRQHARNMALGMATGRYVAFQNSDDEWHPEKLARQLSVLESRPEVGASFTAVTIIDANSKPAQGTWANNQFVSGNEERSALHWLRIFLGRNCLCISSAVVRRDLLKRVGDFRASLMTLSDLDMWIRLVAISDLDVLPETLTYMRVDGDRNLSSPSSSKAIRGMFEMADVLENFARSPLLEKLHAIFPNAGLSDKVDHRVNLAVFAGFVAKHGGVSHRLFADRLLARLIDDAASRKIVLDHCGADLMHFFWRNRSSLIKLA